MRLPSAANLTATFRDLDGKAANLIRRIGKARDDAEKLAALIEKHCPKTSRGIPFGASDSAYRSRARRTEIALTAMDEILGTFGVEPLGEAPDFRSPPPYEYLNAGDPYTATLVYTNATDTIRIGCWGDIAERMPAR